MKQEVRYQIIAVELTGSGRPSLNQHCVFETPHQEECMRAFHSLTAKKAPKRFVTIRRWKASAPKSSLIMLNTCKVFGLTIEDEFHAYRFQRLNRMRVERDAYIKNLALLQKIREKESTV